MDAAQNGSVQAERTLPAYRMAPYRRLLAWLVTDRVGQGLALGFMFAWAFVLYLRGRMGGRRSRPSRG